MPNSQLALFTKGLRKVAARRDPTSSHLAAKAITDDGTLGRQCQETLIRLAAWIGGAPTSAEMAGQDVRLRFQYGRRLADLREKGFVTQGPERRCRRTGRKSVTWSLTDRGRATATQLGG